MKRMIEKSLAYPRDFDIKRAISLKQQANNINALFTV